MAFSAHMDGQQSVNGVEVDPGSSNIEVWANEILNNSGPGITASGVSSLSISGYSAGSSVNPMYVHDNGPINPEDSTLSCTPNCPTHGIDFTGQSQGITLTSVLSYNNAGQAIFFDASGNAGTGWGGGGCLGPGFTRDRESNCHRALQSDYLYAAV